MIFFLKKVGIFWKRQLQRHLSIMTNLEHLKSTNNL